MSKPTFWGLPSLLSSPTAPTLIVETKDDAKAAAKLLAASDWLVTTWEGGMAVISDLNLDPLMGRKLAYWPGADDLGAASGRAFQRLFPNARVIVPPEGMPSGWSLVDAKKDGWLAKDVLGFLEGEIVTEPDPTYEDEPRSMAEEDAASFPELPEELALPERPPFKYLGFFGNPIQFYFLTTAFGKVVRFDAGQLTEANMLTLAHPRWWLSRYPKINADGKRTGGTNWNAARTDLVWKSQEADMFDPKKIRGRGCWLEGKQVVVHTGNWLIRDGKSTPLFASTYVYERGLPLEDDFEIQPLTSPEAAKLLQLFKLVRFREAISGVYLAGWCFSATICGALSWRSHIWITGSAGSGKSTTTQWVKECAGRSSLYARGGTTAAAIRQTTGSDALPVIIDDIESDDEQNLKINQGVIHLMRQSSSPGEAKVFKGTADQEGCEFTTNSSYCCNSISIPALGAADSSRITVIEKLASTEAEFEEIKKLADETVLNPLWCAGLRARARENAVNIIANVRTFSKALARKLGAARAGDQLGTLVASAYGLTNSGIISLEDAEKWVAEQDWSVAESTKAEPEHETCLRHLLDSKLPYPSSPVVYYSISEMIGRLKGLFKSSTDYELLTAILHRSGMYWKDGILTVAAVHPDLKKMFRNTRWADGSWAQCLSRCPGPDIDMDPKRGTRIRTYYIGCADSRRAVRVLYDPPKDAE
jgi:putative DNA primase/helicase